MGVTDRVVIGWILFGVVSVVSLAAAIIVTTLVVTAGETDRLVACVEAGLIWIQGTCI